jgi:hypothetical protein
MPTMTAFDALLLSLPAADPTLLHRGAAVRGRNKYAISLQ